MLAPRNNVSPPDIKITRHKDGRETILVNGKDVSMITMGYDIKASPGNLKILVLHIPIGTLEVSKEGHTEVTTAEDDKPRYI